jgi:DNA phosphorothioation-dependent restriction protein DptG
VQEARSEINKKVKAMEMEKNEKQKKIVQQSVLVSFLNQRLEAVHVASFNHHYKHALVARCLQKQASTADEF